MDWMLIALVIFAGFWAACLRLMIWIAMGMGKYDKYHGVNDE